MAALSSAAGNVNAKPTGKLNIHDCLICRQPTKSRSQVCKCCSNTEPDQTIDWQQQEEIAEVERLLRYYSGDLAAA